MGFLISGSGTIERVNIENPSQFIAITKKLAN